MIPKKQEISGTGGLAQQAGENLFRLLARARTRDMGSPSSALYFKRSQILTRAQAEVHSLISFQPIKYFIFVPRVLLNK